MTIDEAIELLQNEVNHGFRCGYEALNVAFKLGIEALKWKKEFQRYAFPPLHTLLPGETEE